MSNESLLTAADGDNATAVTIEMGEQRFGVGAGRVDPGIYKLKIENACWRNKAEGKAGKNFYFEAVVTGPEGCDGIGTKIPKYDAAPMGDAGDEKVQKAKRRFSNLLGSIASGAGQLDAARAAGSMTITPQQLNGSEFFAFVDDDDPYEGRVKSSIIYTVAMEDYSRKPGADPALKKRELPAADTAPATTGSIAASTPAHAPAHVATQAATPNLLDGGNGVTAGAVTTVAAAATAPGDSVSTMLFGGAK